MNLALRLRGRPQRQQQLGAFWFRAIPLATVFLSLVLVVPARAEDKTAAREHWERGTKYYDLGKYDDAIHEFEGAYEAKGDPAFLYNLAQSHRLAGHANEALRFYRTYLRYVPKPPNRSDIEERIKELEKIVSEHPGGTETAPVAPPSRPGPPSAPVSLPPEATPTEAPASPPAQAAPPTTWPPPAASGPPGAGPESQPNPQPSPMTMTSPDSPTPQAPAVRSGSGRRTAGITLAAVGGGLVVVGAVFGLVTKNQSKKVESASVFDPSAQSLGKTAQTLQWVGYIAGGAALATGIILYATAPSTSSYETPPRVAVAPLAGPGTGGALLRLTF